MGELFRLECTGQPLKREFFWAPDKHKQMQLTLRETRGGTGSGGCLLLVVVVAQVNAVMSIPIRYIHPERYGFQRVQVKNKDVLDLIVSHVPENVFGLCSFS